MSFVNNELNLAKISLFLDKNKKIYKTTLYNMGKIITFDEHTIVLDFYSIEGMYLKIIKLEENEIEIEGTITKVTYQEKQKYKHYRYHLFVNKEAFDHLTLTGIYNVNMKDEVVDFDCNKEIIKKLDNEEVEYKKIDRVKHFFKEILIKQQFPLFF